MTTITERIAEIKAEGRITPTDLAYRLLDEGYSFDEAVAAINKCDTSKVTRKGYGEDEGRYGRCY